MRKGKLLVMQYDLIKDLWELRANRSFTRRGKPMLAGDNLGVCIMAREAEALCGVLWADNGWPMWVPEHLPLSRGIQYYQPVTSETRRL